jgi:FixJ family two-component response regulator
MTPPIEELTDKPVPPVNETDGEPTSAARSRERRLQSAGEVRLLILDDDVGVCDIIQKALASQDFIVDVLSEPASIEAHLLAKKDNPYHLIILDYVIPGVPSADIFGWVQKYQQEASIIVVTGYPSIDSALNCLRARTYDYLTKPFDINQLADVVLRCLESKGLLRMSEDALREALGSVIREKRKGLNLTLADLAKRTDVSLGYLSQIELGKNSASIETLYRISLGLGVKLADLFLAVQQRF